MTEVLTDHRIMIVEDELILAEDMKMQLEELGYSVMGIYRDGETAVQTARREQPDLILMDIMLAGTINGIEAAAQIRDKSDIPIIYITAYTDQELVDQAKKTEPFGYLVKPFNDRDLHVAIDISLYKHKLDRDLRNAYAQLELRVEERTLELSRLNVALRESEQKYRTLITSLNEGVWAFDRNGTTTYVNEKIAKMLGYRVEEMIGKDFFSFVDDHCAETAKAVFQKRISGIHETSEIKFLCKSGTGIFALLETGPLYNDKGEYEGAIAGIINITDRKRMEDALAEANKKLNIMNSITRHDILNELSILFLRLEIGKEKNKDTGCAIVIGQIEEIAGKILRQINFTRDYQEIGVKSIRWQNVPKTIACAAEEAILGSVELQVNMKDVEIFADPLLQKVFYNLIDNAIRYGEHLTKILFQWESSDDGGKIICEDDGVGIPDDLKEKIFNREYYKNTGLGLNLSREILIITGIRIKETGEFGKGARFEIMVPEGGYRLVE